MRAIKRFFRRYFKYLTKPQACRNVMDNLKTSDSPTYRQENIGRLWGLVDSSDLDHMSARDCMDIKITTNHATIGDLILVLRNINDIISVGQYDLVEYLRGIELASQTITLDDFLSDSQGYDYPLTKAIKDFKEVILDHTLIISNSGDNYYQRTLSQLYKDIIELSDVFVDNLKDV